MGSVYKRGKTFWIKYHRGGKPFRESSGSTLITKAQKLLKVREGSIAGGTFVGLTPERTTFEQLAQSLLDDYKINGQAALRNVERYVEILKRFFGGNRAVQITTDRIQAYMVARKEEKNERESLPANATINRELAALKRMFNLGRKAGKVIAVPHIPTLKENNVRKGFFQHRDYLRLKPLLPVYVQGIVTVAYYTGMRRAEIVGLKWDQIEMNERTIRLNPGETKNDEPRVVPMGEEVYQELLSLKELHDKKYPSCSSVFVNAKTGKPVMDFREAWASACKKIGKPEAIFHDLRRTGVRNLVRAGVPEKVAMAISGHKTRSVFDRYNIVDENDIKVAVRSVENYLNLSTGTIQAQIIEAENRFSKAAGAK